MLQLATVVLTICLMGSKSSAQKPSPSPTPAGVPQCAASVAIAQEHFVTLAKVCTSQEECDKAYPLGFENTDARGFETVTCNNGKCELTCKPGWQFNNGGTDKTNCLWRNGTEERAVAMFNYCCGNASPLADTGECFCMQNQANGQSWILSPDKQTCVLGTETEGTRDPNPNTGASLVTVTLTEGGTTTVTTTMTATATAITPA